MANAVTITIQGTDRTNVIPFKGDKGKVAITYTMPGVATADLVVYDPTNSINPADNASVLITDPTTPSNNAFQGYVQKRKAVLVANYRWWELSCVDLNYWLDHKIVGAPDGTNFYESPPATFTPFDPNAVSQGSDAATVQWLFAKYAPDLPVDTTTFVQTMASSMPAGALRWHTVTLRSALQDLANYVGSFVRFWIDADWKFHWTNSVSASLSGNANGPLYRLFPLGNRLTPAPFQLVDTNPDHIVTWNYEDLSVEWDDTGWADSMYVEGATTYSLTEWQMGTYTGGGIYNPGTQVDNIYGTAPNILPIGTTFQMRRYPEQINGLSRYYIHYSGVYNSAGNDIANGYYIDVGRVTPTTVQSVTTTGGSGWVGTTTGTPATLGREGLLRDSRALNQSTRDNIGNSVLTNTAKSVIRGSCKVNISQGGWFPGQAIGITNAVLALTNAQYVIQKVVTNFLSGAGYRTLSIDFGDAPVGTLGLRRNAQQSVLANTGGGGQPARRPASKMAVTVSNAAPAVSGYSRVTAQAVDWAGNPWPIAGAAVSWSVAVYDSAGNDVTGVGGWSFTAGTTQTDSNGSAWGDLQVASTNNWTYFVTATLSF